MYPAGAFMPIPENMPEHAKEIFERIMESLKGKTNPRTSKAYTDEERAKIAWNAVKRKYKKVGESWEAKNEEEVDFEPFYSDLLEYKAADGKYYFKGYLSTFDVDLVNDLVTQECMKDMLMQVNAGLGGFVRGVKGSLDHDVYHQNDPMLPPISKITSAIVDTKGLLVEGMFNPDHPQFPTVWNQVQNGFYDGLSIEYRPIDFSFKDIDGKKVRVLNKVLLKGYGHTPRPANPYSTLVDCFTKSIELADAEEAMKAMTTTSATSNVGTSYSPIEGSIPVLIPTVVDRGPPKKLDKDKKEFFMKDELHAFEEYESYGQSQLASDERRHYEYWKKSLKSDEEELEAKDMEKGYGKEKESEEDEDQEAVKARITAQEGEREKKKMSEEEYYAFPKMKKLPIFDAAHVRNAMARFNQTQGMSAEEKATAKRKIIRAAKKFGIEIGDFAKVGPEVKEDEILTEEVKETVKAEPMPEVKEEPKAEAKAETKTEPSLEDQIKAIVKEELKNLIPEKKNLSDTTDKFEEAKSEPKDLVSYIVKRLGG